MIDTHHHFFPASFARENIDRLVAESGGLARSAFLDWTPAAALEQMDSCGIRTAVVSVTTPGIWNGDRRDSQRLAREANELGAAMGREFPGRFGAFAALPLPDADASLVELAHAFDKLNLAGIGLMTNYENRYLGDPAFSAVFDELDRRGAVVFVHPTSPCYASPAIGVGPAIVEFPTDTTRTIVSLLFSGTFARCPNIRFIFSHGGGTVPFLLGRIVRASSQLGDEERKRLLAEGIPALLERQYYDVAGVATNPAAMAAVLTAFSANNLVLGTDMPYGSARPLIDAIAAGVLSPAEKKSIYGDNAAELLQLGAPT